jgi:hypothetical protein
VALKTSPIWAELSRFGNPYPPFDYGSGMWVEDIGLEEALRLGLVKPGQQIEPPKETFTDQLTGSVKGLSPELRQQLQAEFKDDIVIEGDEAHWRNRPQPAPEVELNPVDETQLPPYKVDERAPAIKFDSWQEGTAWASKYIHPMKQDLKPDQVEALQRAQRGTQEINGKLWTGKELTDDEKQWRDKLQHTIESAPPLPRMVVHKFASGQQWGKYKIGGTVEIPAFVSTTLSDSTEIKRKFSTGAHIEIHVHAGARGMFMDRITGDSKYESEAEIMFPAGTKVHIQSRVWRGDHWHIVAYIV